MSFASPGMNHTLSFSPGITTTDNTTYKNMFSEAHGLYRIYNIPYLPNCNDMSYMFAYCQSLNYNIPKYLNLSNIENIASMFYMCRNLQCKNWNFYAPKVKNAVNFLYCSSFREQHYIENCNFYMNKVENISNAFMYSGSIVNSNFYMNKVEDISDAFTESFYIVNSNFYLNGNNISADSSFRFTNIINTNIILGDLKGNDDRYLFGGNSSSDNYFNIYSSNIQINSIGNNGSDIFDRINIINSNITLKEVQMDDTIFYGWSTKTEILNSNLNIEFNSPDIYFYGMFAYFKNIYYSNININWIYNNINNEYTHVIITYSCGNISHCNINFNGGNVGTFAGLTAHEKNVNNINFNINCTSINKIYNIITGYNISNCNIILSNNVSFDPYGAIIYASNDLKDSKIKIGSNINNIIEPLIVGNNIINTYFEIGNNINYIDFLFHGHNFTNFNFKIGSNINHFNHFLYMCNGFNQNTYLNNINYINCLFDLCYNFNSNIYLNNVNNINCIVSGCSTFNSNIYLNNINYVNCIAYGCPTFNQNIDFSQIKHSDFSNKIMFCNNFNQSVTIPNIATNMFATFYGCKNLAGNLTILSKKVSNVSTMLSSRSPDNRINIFIPPNSDTNNAINKVNSVHENLTWTLDNSNNCYYNNKWNIYVYYNLIEPSL